METQRLHRTENHLNDDRYETLISVREHPRYKNTYIIVEKDSKKGVRISQLNSQFDANIRTDKYDLRGIKI
jgi:hypothetical protein